MHITNLRKVGGSVMLTVPPALLDILHLEAGAKVGISIDDGRLVIEPQTQKTYSLEELIAQCDEAAPFESDAEWISGSNQGRELI